MPDRRQYQGDWSSWVFYGTNRFWHRAQSEPWHARELIIQRLFLAGLECPSEACSANIVSGILALKHGSMATSLSNAELQREFNEFKARDNACITPHIKHTKNFGLSTATVLVLFALCARSPYPSLQARVKQLADGNKGKMAPEDYITTLPTSPTELLASHPQVANKLFDKGNLPVQSHPIPSDIAMAIRGRIKLRPQRQPAQGDLQLQAPSGRPQYSQEMMMAGLRKPTRICMHACLITQEKR